MAKSHQDIETAVRPGPSRGEGSAGDGRRCSRSRFPLQTHDRPRPSCSSGRFESNRPLTRHLSGRSALTPAASRPGRPLWEKVLQMAEPARTSETADKARARLATILGAGRPGLRRPVTQRAPTISASVRAAYSAARSSFRKERLLRRGSQRAPRGEAAGADQGGVGGLQWMGRDSEWPCPRRGPPRLADPVASGRRRRRKGVDALGVRVVRGFLDARAGDRARTRGRSPAARGPRIERASA